MKRHKRDGVSHHEHVTDHAQALVAATGHIVEEKVVQARDRLSKIIDEAKDGLDFVEDKAIEKAKQADVFIRERPYQAVGLAIGIGALLGFCIARRK
jgi:ElaB/YqjD/DUF883 family membrane-anchored ribosome-binding protein